MAHFIKLNQLDVGHAQGEKTYIPTLFNLDTIISIEPSSPHLQNTHSIIQTRWSNNIKVKETLDEILELSKTNVESSAELLTG
jgi:hypothetical protein|tara:strand:+ start:3218 stop:3466 length:249 start_codon:yes stop_codon:yes gene_type:complete